MIAMMDEYRREFGAAEGVGRVLRGAQVIVWKMDLCLEISLGMLDEAIKGENP